MSEVLVFVAGAAVSLWASWLLVSRIERMGGRLGITEALLGLLAALAADAPEVTSAIGALATHQQEVGSGVVVGSNVFNLAALLGLGAVSAGWVALHRRVVVLTGGVAAWSAVVCVLTLAGWLSPTVGLILVLAVLAPYVWLAASRRRTRAGSWLRAAVHEEEVELHLALVQRSVPSDLPVAFGALVAVVGASLVMERAGVEVGHHYSVPSIVVGAVLLAAVTSLPNAVAAVYLARRGRGTAMLSTALNSNVLNIAAGLLIPAVVVGLGRATDREMFVALWNLGLTGVVLVLAWHHRGLRRHGGVLILGAYFMFVAALALSSGRSIPLLLEAGPPAVVLVWALVLMRRAGTRRL